MADIMKLEDGANPKAIMDYVRQCTEMGQNRVFVAHGFVGVIVNDEDMRGQLSDNLEAVGIEVRQIADAENTLAISAKTPKEAEKIAGIVKDFYEPPIEEWKDGEKGVGVLTVVRTTQSPEVASELQKAVQNAPTSQGRFVVAVVDDTRLVAPSDLVVASGLPAFPPDKNGNTDIGFTSKEELNGALNRMSQLAELRQRCFDLNIEYASNRGRDMQESQAREIAVNGTPGVVIQEQDDGRIIVSIAGDSEYLNAAKTLAESYDAHVEGPNESADVCTLIFESDAGLEGFLDEFEDEVVSIDMDKYTERDPDFDDD